MTSAFKLHDVVMQVSSEAKNLIPKMPVVTRERQLLYELVLCILSSQEKYEIALGVMKAIKKRQALKIPKTTQELNRNRMLIQEVLSEPVSYTYKGKKYSGKLRFHKKKGDYIVSTLNRIYLNELSIKDILKGQDCKLKARKNIIQFSTGLGPKQASMFLRNIGYGSDFAIIDKHIIDFMRIMGLSNMPQPSFPSINQYQQLENSLKVYAATFNVNLLHLDLAIWTTMRTVKNNIQ